MAAFGERRPDRLSPVALQCNGRLTARQSEHEPCAGITSLAFGAHTAAVELDQVTNDRQAQSKPGMTTGARIVSLAEAIEYVGKECRVDADSRSLTVISMSPSWTRALTSTRPPSGVNLTAFDNRFHTACCSRIGSPVIERPAAR